MQITTTLSVTDEDGQAISTARGRRKSVPGTSAQALLVEADAMQSELLLFAVADLTRDAASHWRETVN